MQFYIKNNLQIAQNTLINLNARATKKDAKRKYK